MVIQDLNLEYNVVNSCGLYVAWIEDILGYIQCHYILHKLLYTVISTLNQSYHKEILFTKEAASIY